MVGLLIAVRVAGRFADRGNEQDAEVYTCTGRVVWLILPQIPDEWIIQFERSHSVLHGVPGLRPF